MRYALPLSALLAAASAAPCFADPLSFNDLSPWIARKVLHAALTGQLNPGSTTVPKTGTASYQGITVGTADLTPSTTKVTAHDRLTGTMALDVNFATQSLSGSFNNLTAIDPKSHARTNVGTLFIENLFTPVSGKSYSATVSTFSAFEPIGGQLSGHFIGPNASLTAGHWQASGTIPLIPTPTSSTAVSLHAGFVAARK